MRRLTPLLTLLLLLAAAPAARADWFRADPVDGPAEIDALGGVDLARDGGGGVVYIKRDGGVPQAFVSRMIDGQWRPPEKVSAGPAVSEAKITAMDGGRLAVVWVAGADVLGSVLQGTAPPTPPVVLGGGGASGIDVDMGINEVGYAVWQAGGDVRAARLAGRTWTPLGAPLDISPADEAGTGALRPRVAVSAEGNAVATWAEAGGDNRTHVWARRLTGLVPSSFPQDLTLDAFEGQPAGAADSPDIDIEDDGSFAWVAFRQDAGGRSRTVARRLRGSLFEDPFAIDAGATSFAPRIDFAGKGIGGAVAAAGDNAVFSSYLDKFDKFNPAVRVDATPGQVGPAPDVATSERGDVYVAWRTGDGNGGDVRARRKNGELGFEPEFLASRPDLGPVAPGQLAIAADRSGNSIVAMLQGAPGARRVTAAVYDRLPGRPVVLNSIRYRARKPLIKWLVGSENWGRQTFTVYVDGKALGRTTRNRLVSPRALGKGTHRYQVRATDRRGQTSVSRTRTFRVDPGLPVLKVTIRRRGRTVTVSTVARDRGPAGLDYVRIDWGDKAKRERRRSSVHHYKKGRYTLVVQAVDKAGNVTSKKKALRIP
jgi:hypothetical protein